MPNRFAASLAPLDVARGAIMGLADVVPGVSGGTMALLLGIYGRFIAALAAVDLRLFRLAVGVFRPGGWAAFWEHARQIDFPFLLRLGSGIALALVAGAHLIGGLIETNPAVMMAVFFGLILASARLPWKQMARPRAVHALPAVLGAGIAAVTVLLPEQAGTPPTAFLFVAGMIAITAMLLPGISGSALLVLLGAYTVVLDAVRSIDLLPLAVFAVGAAVGLLAGSRAIKWLLFVHRDVTLATLTGLMIGSLVRIWPWRTSVEFGMGLPAAPSGATLWFVMLAGAIASWALERIAQPSTAAPQ